MCVHLWGVEEEGIDMGESVVNEDRRVRTTTPSTLHEFVQVLMVTARKGLRSDGDKQGVVTKQPV